MKLLAPYLKNSAEIQTQEILPYYSIKQMHPPEAVANYFLQRAWSENKGLTPIKVIKLTYIAHGWFLGFTKERLVDDDIQAWKYGPVLPRLYNAFKYAGNQPIDCLAEMLDKPYEAEFSSLGNTVVDAVWEKYKDMTGLQLSALTHDEGTPWYQVWHEEGGSKNGNSMIPSETIKKYYEDLLNSPSGD